MFCIYVVNAIINASLIGLLIELIGQVNALS